MSKKNRQKAKAKRFGEGSARAAVDASTYGAGNAFGSAFVSSTVVDPARTALIADVAAFAQRRYDAVIVFDGAGNVSADRPNLPQAGVRIEFSPTGVSADTVVQRLCIEAREAGRACSVVTSDGTIQATVMGKGVTRISARMLVDEIRSIDADVAEAEEAPQVKLTLGSRLSPEALAKLEALRNRG